MKTITYLLLTTAIALLIGCAPKPEPYTIQACIDGQQVAEFRDACLGPRPADGEEPTDGQYNAERCSQLQLRIGQFCDSPAAVAVEAIVDP